MWDFQSELDGLQELGRFRSPVPLEPISSFRAKLHGRELWILCANDYLGLRMSPELVEAGQRALQRWGSGSGAARQVSGDLPPHRELESKLSSFLQAESSLLFSSGYLANIGAIPALVREGDLLLSDERNHASLIDACRLSKAQLQVYRHLDLEDLERKLHSAGSRRVLVVTESLFSMDGDLLPLPEILRLKKKYSFALYLDEAHSIGVLGNSGQGIAEEFGIDPREIDLRMGTLSKALGSQGAFVSGKKMWIDYLRNTARSYLFDTALSPVCAASACAAVEQIQSHPKRVRDLRALVQAVRLALPAQFALDANSPSPFLPLFVGEESMTMALSKWLSEEGFFVQGIRPPTVAQGSSRLRLTVNLGVEGSTYFQFFKRLEKGAEKFHLKPFRSTSEKSLHMRSEQCGNLSMGDQS